MSQAAAATNHRSPSSLTPSDVSSHNFSKKPSEANSSSSSSTFRYQDAYTSSLSTASLYRRALSDHPLNHWGVSSSASTHSMNASSMEVARSKSGHTLLLVKRREDQENNNPNSSSSIKSINLTKPPKAAAKRNAAELNTLINTYPLAA